KVSKVHGGLVTPNYASGTGSAVGFTPNDDGSYTVSLTATDRDGDTIAPATTAVTVSNLAPTASLSVPASAVRVQPATFTLTATDVSSADAQIGFCSQVNGGDGSPAQTVLAPPGNGSGTAVEHAYAAAGTYCVQVTATDKDGGTSTAVMQNVVVTTAALSGAVRTVSCTPADDTIIIALTPGSPTTATVSINGAVQGVCPGVSQVVAFGGVGSDTIRVVGRLAIPAELYGGDGNDTLQGGLGPNLLV